MKILLVTDLDVESGRGPITRFAHVLPGLCARADVVVAALGPADDVCAKALADNGVAVHPLEFTMLEWRVQRLDGLVGDIERIVLAERPDVVVLYREIWDLMRGLSTMLGRHGVPFLYMPHSMPFLDSMARPSSSFALDFVRRLLSERRGYAARYILSHVHQAGLLRTLPRIVINETVGSYLDRYFPSAPTVTAIPGYAIDLPAIRAAVPAEKSYDVAFMAKLTAGKGIFDLLSAVRILRRSRPGLRVVVIGSFDDSRTRRRFLSRLSRYGLTDTVHLAGWLTGPDKYRLLGSAKVFCCTSISNDTFSLCLLEALACGLPAACYDMPFIHAVYRDTPAVHPVPLRRPSAMAAQLHGLLDAPTPSPAALAFAARYASWDSAAAAEIAAYTRFLTPARVSP